MKFSKGLAERSKQEMIHIENRLRLMETTIHFTQNPDYLICQGKLGNLYEKEENDLRITRLV